MQINDRNILSGMQNIASAPPVSGTKKKAESKENTAVNASQDEVQLSGSTKYGFTEGNLVIPLQTGGGKNEILPTITDMVSNAKDAVQVQMYRLGHNKIVDVLADQARKGVKVQVLMDPSEGYDAHDAVEQKEIQKYLQTAGVEILKYPIDGPKGKIDHVKMLIVDGKSLLIGGMNWDQHSPLNKDYDVKITGPAVGDAQDVFNNDWKLAGGDIIPGLKPLGPQPGGDAKVRMLTTEVDRKDINTALQANIKGAKKNIRMEAFALADKDTIQNLVDAAGRGVDVRVILDPNVPISFINAKSARTLKEGGVQVKWRDVNVDEREKLHAKIAMFDEDKTIIGSCNFTKAGLAVNHEADVEVVSKSVGSAFTKMFDEHWENESVSKQPFLPDFYERIGEEPPKEQMAKEMFRYMGMVFRPEEKRMFTGKKKAAVLEAIDTYDKTKKPAPLTTILGNSGKTDAIDLQQEMEAVGDISSFVNDLPDLKMDPKPGDRTPLYEHRLAISEKAAKEVPANIPKYLKDMVDCIETKEIRDFVQKAVSQLPEGFLMAPSASSGKYHPADEVDPNDVNASMNKNYPPYKGGGLVLHSRRVQKMAAELCDHYGVKGRQKDEILAGMALHDAMKGVTMEELKDAMDNGKPIPWNKTTTAEHGLVAAEWIKRLDPTGGKMTKNIQKYAANHMSIWNKPAPTPPEDIGNFICSVADYTVSQKNFYLDVNK